MNTEIPPRPHYLLRRWLILAFFCLVVCVLIWRVIDLQLLNNDFLRTYGDARSLRIVEIPAHRGVITDRNGNYLAISTPVESVWARPRLVLQHADRLPALAALLGTTATKLRRKLLDRSGRDFFYLKRQAGPDLADKVLSLDIPGVYLEPEYKRYYPQAEMTAHIIGFTDIDDIGQEGIELAYDDWLRGRPGKKRVLKDRLGRVVEQVEGIQSSESGRELALSIDRRIQYLAYRELKTAVIRHKAKGGSLVLLDVTTGEVLALVGQPSYNPNNRSDLRSEYYRNRVVTDVFEPGSALKPFTILAALSSGLYKPDTLIDTRPGYLKVGDHVIRDIRSYGVIDVATVIRKSSNVGTSKIALSLQPETFWKMLSHFGFGQPAGSVFPGEAAGKLARYNNWSEVEMATIAFGYGLSVSVLQLAKAYSVIAADGVRRPISFIHVADKVDGHRVISAQAARQIRLIMETVVSDQGTGGRASVHGYRIAGKTGTVHKSTRGGYSEDQYLSIFAGMAPVSKPRLVMVVTIDEPRGSQYYGGQVAAPVFSGVMEGALRIMNLPPDDLPAFEKQSLAGITPYDVLPGFGQ